MFVHLYSWDSICHHLQNRFRHFHVMLRSCRQVCIHCRARSQLPPNMLIDQCTATYHHPHRWPSHPRRGSSRWMPYDSKCEVGRQSVGYHWRQRQLHWYQRQGYESLQLHVNNNQVESNIPSTSILGELTGQLWPEIKWNGRRIAVV